MSVAFDAQAWQQWITDNSRELIGGDVEELRRGICLRGPIKGVALNGSELVFMVDWLAVDDQGWRINRAHRPKEVTFDLRGVEIADMPQTGILSLQSRSVVLKIYMRSSGNKLDRSQVRNV